jgi:hypothetical protein
MKARIERSFYAMGRALAVLDDPRVFHALGHTSFTTARGLLARGTVRIVARVHDAKELARALG